VISFGQISPLKKGAGGKNVILKSFFYYKRENRNSQGKGQFGVSFAHGGYFIILGGKWQYWKWRVLRVLRVPPNSPLYR